MKLSETSILITGAGRGIGQFIALGLLGKAGKVIVIDNNRELLKELPEHPDLNSHYCDITQPEAVAETVASIFERDGGINVCINNAGIIHSEPLINILSRGDKKHSLTNWRKVIDVNLNAVFYVSSNVAERMVARKEKGVIINISSICAR